MRFDSLPPEIQAIVNQTGLRDRIAAIAPLVGDFSDGEVIERFLAPVRNDLLICHYTSWERFVGMLDNDHIFMRRIDQFHDTRDATFTDANRHSMTVLDANLQMSLPSHRDVEATIASHEIYRTRAYAHCWFEGWTESPRMWHEYGLEGGGVCLLTRCSRLLAALRSPEDQFHLFMRGCFYRDDHEPIPENFGSLPLFCKRRKYQHENEIRLVAAINEEVFRGEVRENIEMPLVEKSFIERLLTGPNMSLDEVNSVKVALKERLPHLPVLSPRITSAEVSRAALAPDH